jgi:hypothetical protein
MRSCLGDSFMVVTRKEIPLYPKPFREANVLNNLCYEGHPSRGYGCQAVNAL